VQGKRTAPAGDAFERARATLKSQKPLRDRVLRQAAAALESDRPNIAEGLLSTFLKKHPQNPGALYLMAETALWQDLVEEAEALLKRCLEVSPDYRAARFAYADTLARQHKSGLAVAELDVLLERDPGNLLYRDLSASLLLDSKRYGEAQRHYRELARDYPDIPQIWIRYGFALRTAGLREECITAYRRAIALCPSSAEAYWCLSSLKTYRFADAEIAHMQQLLLRPGRSANDRAWLHFAMGKARDDQNDWAEAFDQYAKANAIRRVAIPYSADATTARVAQCQALFTREFFAGRSGSGCPSSAPVFIVGLQRSGSTLVEQILASHSSIEGAGELPQLGAMAIHLEKNAAPVQGHTYPDVLGQLDADSLMRLGEEYLQGASGFRHLGRRLFTDKQPFNFWHIGLIQLILPNARIIDVRRHPLACCWSNFTTNFPQNVPFAYRLSDLGRHYADYTRLMAHFDSVLPGKIYRIGYEALIGDFETEVRRLLDYLDLPFEEACLQFHHNARGVDTISAEQVRMPIFKSAVEHWRHYEPWLTPLKTALRPVLERVIDVPTFGD